MSLGLERGIQLSNMPPGPREFHQWFQGRHAVKRFSSDAIADFISTHTPADARVLSPYPDELTIATGRPNASGFAHHLHIIVGRGPGYKDAIRFLEPAAIRQLGIDYVHTTETWKAGLPDHAQQWLANPELFELLIRDGSDALYLVQSAFQELDATPSPGSFESLRRAVPQNASIYISADLERQAALRLAAALPHAQLFGHLQPSALHMLPRIPIAPLDNSQLDLVATSSRLAPSSLPPSARRPRWWTEGIAIYTPTAAIPFITNAPHTHFSVQLTDVSEHQDQVLFTTTFIDYATSRWTGQDWVVIPADTSPWTLPSGSSTSRHIHPPARAFRGQLQPVSETKVHKYLYLYAFDRQRATLAMWDGATYADLPHFTRKLKPGLWLLAIRIFYQNREVGLIPVLRFDTMDPPLLAPTVYSGILSINLDGFRNGD